AFEREVRSALAEVRARVERFRSGAGRPAAETVRDFDRLLQPLNGWEGRAGLFVNVHPDAAMRTACEGLERECADVRTASALDRAVYERLARTEADGLAPDARRVLTHALRDFRRSGVDREEETRERVRRLQEELVAIGQEYDRNIVEGGREFVVSEGRAG